MTPRHICHLINPTTFISLILSTCMFLNSWNPLFIFLAHASPPHHQTHARPPYFIYSKMEPKLSPLKPLGISACPKPSHHQSYARPPHFIFQQMESLHIIKHIQDVQIIGILATNHFTEARKLRAAITCSHPPHHRLF